LCFALLLSLPGFLPCRMGQQQQGQYRQYNQQQYGQYGQPQYGQYGQQQQQYSRLPGRAFKPPPPPVERFGPAFSGRGYASGPVVLRSLLWETAYGCQVRKRKSFVL
jgi:hypothetical protein